MEEDSRGSCLPVLVLVQSQRVGAVLVVVDPVLPLLAQLEEVPKGALHHVLGAARADPRHVSLRVHHQHLRVQPATGEAL